MNILFDGNYLFWKSMSVVMKYDKDNDFAAYLSKKENQDILIRKSLIDMFSAINRFQNVDKVTVVIDSNSWRYTLHDDYKYALTKVKEEYHKYFLIALNEFQRILLKKGFIVSRIPGAEGDDLLYLWALYFDQILEEDVLIVTGDSDIGQVISGRTSLFNNNSERLTISCIKGNEDFWKATVDDSISVKTINPLEVTLYKTIMGDTSDNIPKLKRGFGKVAFSKFLDRISTCEIKEETELLDFAQWITKRFCDFTGDNYEETLGKIIFNLKMTWLNLSVYNSTDYICENNKSLLQNILNDISEKKDSYSYNKAFSLESFFNMIIK